jgi:hypothetical protein
MSSDLPDDVCTYPSIIDFIETLITKVPQRQSLREAGLNLHTLHYYGIDEITTLTADEFGTDKFGNVLRGDAEYLLGQVRKEVKRLDKERVSLGSDILVAQTLHFDGSSNRAWTPSVELWRAFAEVPRLTWAQSVSLAEAPQRRLAIARLTWV